MAAIAGPVTSIAQQSNILFIVHTIQSRDARYAMTMVDAMRLRPAHTAGRMSPLPQYTGRSM
ncbi:hypothetical protein B9Y63_10990 [Stenotrophomonas maltophilia]|nr:hypothetical protein B9Y63_10990 [Stenotrophomonas maltophilia]